MFFSWFAFPSPFGWSLSAPFLAAPASWALRALSPSPACWGLSRRNRLGGTGGHSRWRLVLWPASRRSCVPVRSSYTCCHCQVRQFAEILTPP